MLTEQPDKTSRPARRIAVVGTTGSRKTTLAAALAGRLGVPHIELDALAWGPAWVQISDDLFRSRLEEATRGDAWVVDGNYSRARDVIWARAEMVVWLDYPLRTILGRLLRRTVRRVLTREPLWNGNRESLRTALFSRDAILIWALRTYQRRRREYPELLSRPEHAHLQAVRHRSPRAAARWLAALPRAHPPVPS